MKMKTAEIFIGQLVISLATFRFCMCTTRNIKFRRHATAQGRLSSPVKLIEGLGLQECCAQCNDEGTYIAINYHAETERCELVHNVNVYETDGIDGWKVYIVKGLCKKSGASFKGSCYFSESGQVASWYAAMKKCAVFNAHLIIIESEEENDFIKYKLEEHDKHSNQFWTAGNRLGVKDLWVWSEKAELSSNGTVITNGTDIEFTDWGQGESEEECLALDPFKTGYQWITVNCDNKIRYICELYI